MYTNCAVCSHFEEIRLAIQQHKPNIFVITETHLTDKHNVNLYDVLGYDMVNCLSNSSHTGGVTFYIKKSIKWSMNYNGSGNGNWFLSVYISGGVMKGMYGGLYHSPNASDSTFLKCLEDEWLPRVLENDGIVTLIGDFNINWLDNVDRHELKNLMDSVSLCQRVNFPTRVNHRSSTMIDLVFSNSDKLSVIELPLDKISDHATMGLVMENSTKEVIPHRIKIKCWKKYSRSRLQTELRWKMRDFHQCCSTDSSAEKLSEAIESTVNSMVEEKEIVVTDTAPWYTSSLKSLKILRDEAHLKFRSTRNQSDWNDYQIKRNSYVYAIRDAKKSAVQQELRACSNNSKKLWKSLKRLMNPAKNTDIGVRFSNIDDDLDDKAKADKLNDYFIDSVKQIHNSIPESNLNDSENTESSSSNSRWSVFEPVDMTRLKKTVYNLKQCGGINNVNTTVMIDAFEAIKYEFLALINMSLSKGEFPSSWKKSLVVPLPKVPNSQKPEDRRPINMLPLYEKVIELIVKEELMSFLNNHDILLPEQSGFRKHHSCETALNSLLFKWKNALEDRKVVLAIFLDLKKAFETIDRNKLISTLHNIGISGKVIDWFKSYLTMRTQATIYRGQESDYKYVDLGVPQGSVLGPILFILYVNDIKDVVTLGNINLFADDTVLFVIADSIAEAYSVMKLELSKLTEWLKMKKLKLNVKKTKYMLITNKIRTGHVDTLSIDGEVVEQVNVVKYLGVMVDEKLNFNEHIDYIIRKAASKYGMLCKINKFLSFDNKVMLYKTLVAPHFEYCASILFLASKRQMTRMQTVQNRTMRLILGCDRMTPSRLMRDMLQWMPVKDRITLRTLTLVFKIKHGLTPTYLTENIQYGSDVHQYETRRANDFRLPNLTMTGTQNSLFFKGFRLFNTLPDEIKGETNELRFKHKCIQFLKNMT